MPTEAKRPCTILLIDDNHDLITAMADLVADLSDFRMVVAEDGVEGLERFDEVHPDCVVIDVVMPHIDGFRLVRALRGDPRTAQTPLIILTALAQEKEQYAGMITGVDRYLLKPTLPTELITAIQETMAITPEERAARILELANDTSDPPK